MEQLVASLIHRPEIQNLFDSNPASDQLIANTTSCVGFATEKARDMSTVVEFPKD